MNLALNGLVALGSRHVQASVFRASLPSGRGRLRDLARTVVHPGLSLQVRLALQPPPSLVTTATRHASQRLAGRNLLRNLITARVKKTYSTESKPGIYQRLKQLIKDYWYIALPVHTINCSLWFGAIYFSIASGLDVVSWLEKMHFPQAIVDKVKNSPGLGNLALALLIYKLATPARYLISISLTGLAIRIAARRGLITSSQAIKEAHAYTVHRRAHFAARYRKEGNDWRKRYLEHRERLRENYQQRMKRFRK